MMQLTRRDPVRAVGLILLAGALGCAAAPNRTGQPPAPYAPSEFTGLIGVAREDITPPIGIYARSWGAAKHDVAEGIHRPLTLTALTFQSSHEDAPLVLIAADLGWWKSRDDEWHVRGGVIDAMSLDPAR